MAGVGYFADSERSWKVSVGSRLFAALERRQSVVLDEVDVLVGSERRS
jgi:hypothetical protein